MLITPKKIEYAREKEQNLFDSLSSLASMKQEEIKNLINSTIEANRKDILDASKAYKFVDIDLINISSSSNDEYLNIDRKNSSSDDFTSSGDYESRFITVKCAQDYKKCTNQIQELVINKLNNAIGQKLTESIEILKETYKDGRNARMYARSAGQSIPTISIYLYYYMGQNAHVHERSSLFWPINN